MLGLVGLCLWMFLSTAPGVFTHVPNTRDPSLVGIWKGTYENRSKTGIYTLYPEGEGKLVLSGMTMGRGMRIVWGTERGRIEFKFRSAGEGYNHYAFPYTLSNDHVTVTLEEGGNWAFAPEWTRVGAIRGAQ